MSRKNLGLVLAILLVTPLVLASCSQKRVPISSVVLHSKLDKKIVALNVHLKDFRLAEVASGIAKGELQGPVAIAKAMAERQVPYIDYEIYRADSDDLDTFVTRLRRLSPARCGLVDKPQETAICARAVVDLNQAPSSGSVNVPLRIQGAALGSAIAEEVLLLTPSGEVLSAEFSRKERSFEATITPSHGEGLYTLEIIARTGRGHEPAARWWVAVGNASYPQERSYTAEAEDASLDALAQTAFAKLNSDRASVNAKAISRSTALVELAKKRAADYAANGAVSPADQEELAKLRLENNKALSNFAETLSRGISLQHIGDDIIESPAKRRSHLDPFLSTGGIALARGRAPDNNIYLVEVMGRAYNPDNPSELRDAIVDRINQARARKTNAPVSANVALQRYAQKIAEGNLQRNRFFDKDDMGRSIDEAVIQDLEKIVYTGSEMMRVNGAEEVIPSTTVTEKRFTQVGVGLARKSAGLWWVVIIVATTGN